MKADIESGTPTRYTAGYPIYRENMDEFQGGPVYIFLSNPDRNPVQTVSGSILYEKRSCTIEIVATSADNREDIYDDICDILIATSRGYKLKRAKDNPVHAEQNRILLEVEILL